MTAVEEQQYLNELVEYLQREDPEALQIVQSAGITHREVSFGASGPEVVESRIVEFTSALKSEEPGLSLDLFTEVDLFKTFPSPPPKNGSPLDALARQAASRGMQIETYFTEVPFELETEREPGPVETPKDAEPALAGAGAPSRTLATRFKALFRR